MYLLFFNVLFFIIFSPDFSVGQEFKPVIREECLVVIDSVTEQWRLEWRTPPKSNCIDEDWYVCPCSGFAFGEKGELDLIRIIPGKPEERLSLTPFYNNTQGSPSATLPKWPVYDGDYDRIDSANILDIVKDRPIVKIMNLADYDHDYRATEFLLQINAQACGHRQTVLVGISRVFPKLHVFGTINHPNIPLVLQHPNLWNSLLYSDGDTTVVDWKCGDHGSDNEERVEIQTSNIGIRAFRLMYSCETDSTKSKLIKREEL